jgi:hypothetical protein
VLAITKLPNSAGAPSQREHHGSERIALRDLRAHRTGKEHMADFIQLAVKRRKTKRGFLDLLHEYRNNIGDRAKTGRKIKQTVERWLISDGFLSDPPEDDERVSPFAIEFAPFNRVCEIAGHAWIEFVKDASDDWIQDGSYRAINDDDFHLAEFGPVASIDRMLEVFAEAQGGPVLWRSVTADQIVDLFAPMLDESQERRRAAPESRRPANGFVGGSMYHLSPDMRREYPPGWFDAAFKKPTGDRFGAYVTPFWQVKLDTQVLNRAHPFYSFTPEHYETTDNCITWASRVLDNLLTGDWLDDIRTQCRTAHPYCFKRCIGVVRKACVDYHVREQGRVKCLDLYLRKADGARIKRLKKFA